MKKKLLLLLLISYLPSFAQGPVLSISNTSTSAGCIATIDGVIYSGAVPNTNNSEIDFLLNPNGTTGTYAISMNIDWGDGSTSGHQGTGNTSTTTGSVSMNPPIQHAYSNYGT